MNPIKTLFALGFLLLPAVDGQAQDSPHQEEVLLVRFACLLGARQPGEGPVGAGVLSSEELSRFLLKWEPTSDNEEVRRVFALERLDELVRQAAQLPLTGGQVSGVYGVGDTAFGVELSIQTQPEAISDDAPRGAALLRAEFRRGGELLSAPSIRVPLGERGIVSTSANGPEGPYLFLVVELDRIDRGELQRRGLTYAWSDDFMLVDGDKVSQPIAIEKRSPSYPPEAKEKKFQGTVVLRMIIDESGSVRDVEIVEGQPYGLSEAAVEAARQWRFEPARYQGKPVAVIYLVTVNFKLQ